MSYADFTIEKVEAELGVRLRRGIIFAQFPEIVAPLWRPDQLSRGMELAFRSEKARSELIVAPILLSVRELALGRIAIYSVLRLDVEAKRNLTGECDSILARSETLPRLRAPLLAIVEAKKNDIESGLGQCIAQMVAAQVFNERAANSVANIYGCVTTGEDWQFLRLENVDVTIESIRFYINEINLLLSALVLTIQ